MFNLSIAAAAGLGKLGYDLWNKSDSKSERRQFSDYQYQQYLNSLLESPSAQRKGLEAAGYNPMLALGSIGGSSFSGSALPDGFGGVSDFVGSAKQANDLLEDIKRKREEESDIRKAEANKIEAEADKTRSAIEVDNATIEKLKSDTLNTNKDTWLNNPIVNGIAGILGYKAAEKIGGWLGGSAKGVANNSVLKGIEAASKLPKGIPASPLGLGSKMLRGMAIPALFGTATEWALEDGLEAQKNRPKETKYKNFYGGGIPSYHNF